MKNEFNPEPLKAAARAYAKACVDAYEAWEAHQKNRHLDQWHSRRCKTEKRLYHAENAKTSRRLELCLAALLFSGGDAADLSEKYGVSFA